MENINNGGTMNLWIYGQSIHIIIVECWKYNRMNILCKLNFHKWHIIDKDRKFCYRCELFVDTYHYQNVISNKEFKNSVMMSESEEYNNWLKNG